MIQKLDINNFDNIYDIMEASFPPDERRTYQEQKELLANPRYEIYVAPDMETGSVMAFMAVWEFDEFAFIEHFAVSDAYRNSGIGSAMLQEMMRELSLMICLEVELPDSDIAKRRIGFYERNGFCLNTYPYVQPPISEGRNALPLMIMTSGGSVSKEKFEKIKLLLYQHVYHASEPVMDTVTISVSIDKGDIDNLITRYHFQEEDRAMLDALCRVVAPLLDVHAYYLSNVSLKNVDLEQYVAAFLTLGEGMDTLQEVYLDRNHVSEAYMLECIGLELLTKAYDAFAGHVQMAMGMRAVRMHFLGDKYPYSIMDEMKQQMGEIHIAFNDQYNMMPQKSVAFLLELTGTAGAASFLSGEEDIRHAHNSLCHVHLAHICATCNNTDCEYRQRENYTYGYQRIFGGQSKKG